MFLPHKTVCTDKTNMKMFFLYSVKRAHAKLPANANYRVYL